MFGSYIQYETVQLSPSCSSSSFLGELNNTLRKSSQLINTRLRQPFFPRTTLKRWLLMEQWPVAIHSLD